ncbi:LysM peptidoglycan-binding domain-containing protein [Salinimonas sediminis]|uniref:LysM peptidoglycan-binding domain-containing protein n=1 Tax=Salinimonas sediminis TaxID=2303538 RepID=A0A346NND5_9ALTE|nr:LysM peptidoglycan-binding domain-containing protein [Salinimonas sediminis]AXR07042.1 LysM peptidoglycan-binding domain-containing protein [Salinimonas sediminis]
MRRQWFVLSSIALALALSGCQSTEPQTQSEITEPNTTDDRDGCEVGNTPIDSEQDCDIAKDGVIDVVHPKEDIAVKLEPKKSKREVSEAPIVITNVWDRIANQSQFAIPDDKRLLVQRNWYLKHPEYMARVVKRADPFLYYITEQIEARKMPLELALLPIVESAFDPFAYSHGRAAGMWQFIPGTAKRFGIRQSWWYDGRRDVIASTAGALDYLNYLNKYFDGNWLHALAAYNSGEGRVSRAIKRNKKLGKPTDFWSLDLPRETRAYVPKLLALADILRNREAYDFAWPEIENVPVIEVVEIGSQVDLAFAADLAQMELEALQALNPGFNRWATDPDGPHHLVLPVDKAQGFTTELAKIDRQERLNWVRHRVKRGDSLLRLAGKYHTIAAIIKQVNDLDSDVIRIGQAIMVPVALKELNAYALSQDQRLASLQNIERADHKLVHKVVSGDTFWDISRKYDISSAELAKWNGMAPNDTLQPGQELVIWTNQVSQDQRNDAIIKSLTYTVRNGDSLSRIASKFNVRINDIKKWNDLQSHRYLQPGQKLKLFVDVTRLKNIG